MGLRVERFREVELANQRLVNLPKAGEVEENAYTSLYPI